jgi:hypothetical protein
MVMLGLGFLLMALGTCVAAALVGWRTRTVA